jgi:tetratricopeptide (TPR) repeat protein
MDEVSDSLAAIDVSKPRENAKKTRREELINNADAEREHGSYTKALALYREAEAIEANLSVSVKIAGLLTEQGRTPLALREWNQALARFALHEVDRELVAVAELCRSLCEGAMDIQFRRVLAKGLKYFEEYVKPFPVKEWKGRKVGGFPEEEMVPQMQGHAHRDTAGDRPGPGEPILHPQDRRGRRRPIALGRRDHQRAVRGTCTLRDVR